MLYKCIILIHTLLVEFLALRMVVRSIMLLMNNGHEKNVELILANCLREIACKLDMLGDKF